MSPKKLVSGAMSADIDREGQRTTAAPLGHALLEVAAPTTSSASTSPSAA